MISRLMRSCLVFLLLLTPIFIKSDQSADTCTSTKGIVLLDLETTCTPTSSKKAIDPIATFFESNSNQTNNRPQQKKAWTLIIYMAADNDLRGFSARNIKEMASIGSNENINIVVQLDIRIAGNRKITRRYYIEKNKIVHVNANDPASQKMDSGAPETLISCCSWAITNYPAENFGLVFWNHGTGCIDPARGRIINPAELFNFDPVSNKLKLDRSIGFLDFINAINKQEELRGICWDDSTGNYLTNQSLDYALSVIQQNLLGGKKFSLIGFDACLMSMIEIANIVKKYARVMVSSQEVELGAGWNYSLVLAPFLLSAISTENFASHIVNSYEKTYQKITNDFTLSAINLDDIDLLENNTDRVAQLLLQCLSLQRNNSAKRAIQASRNRSNCTYFDEPSYIDQHHFYSNLLANSTLIELNDSRQNHLINQLKRALEEGCAIIEQLVFANKVGQNLAHAEGISIYFPERNIHPSYRKTTFAATNNWLAFLTHYLSF